MAKTVEATPGFEPGIRALQARTLLFSPAKNPVKPNDLNHRPTSRGGQTGVEPTIVATFWPRWGKGQGEN